LIFIPSKKFIYFRVPRTASTSVSNYLLDNLSVHTDLKTTQPDFLFEKKVTILDNIPVHANIRHLLDNRHINENEIKDYRMFAVIRDPVDWIISHAFADLPVEFTTNKYLNEIVASYLNDVYAVPQVSILKYKEDTLSDIYTYDNLNYMIQEVFKYLNVAVQPVNSYNHRSERRSDKVTKLDRALIDRIYNQYEADYTLYHKITLQEQNKKNRI
jgi:hypothetical protein